MIRTITIAAMNHPEAERAIKWICEHYAASYVKEVNKLDDMYAHYYIKSDEETSGLQAVDINRACGTCWWFNRAYEI